MPTQRTTNRQRRGPAPRRRTDEERGARRREQIRRNQAAIAMLDAWARGDARDQEEQRETWEFLRRALDEDRISSRPLFPPAVP
jgi:hypothetical protein